ncbi:MAG: KpsF/GutQ family sugar-phosphate isomerase [Ignavibacteriae bacterium]|nr:KpsF/GutQ family sugar-phosphate isomerase [Ignavibacteriota bacterium]
MNKIIKDGRLVVKKEKNAVFELEKRFSENSFRINFARAVEEIYKCKGKVVISGMGKSGIIAQKIVATFNSTGTNAIFLHSADSIHGDLGVVREDDVVILISKSGGTVEVMRLMPVLKNLGVKIILITGNLDSQLSETADIVLNASVKEEACPLNLAPTSSSTAALVLGDAIAIALLEKRGFTKEDFAAVHPGGILGRKLLLKIKDIMVREKDIPVVSMNTGLKDVIYMISSKRLGCTVVLNKNKIAGIITDGDIRRLLQKDFDINKITAKDIMCKNPKTIFESTLAKNALGLMEKNKVTQLIICNSKNKLVGIVHIHSLVELGL